MDWEREIDKRWSEVEESNERRNQVGRLERVYHEKILRL